MNPDVPPPDDVTEDWWAATREHRLVLQTCRACGHVQHPPRAVCVGCSADRLDLVEASGEAAVDTWTVVHRAPRPEVAVPYTIARVRLVEGPVLLTVIDAPEEPVLGAPVRVAWFDLPDGRALPIFRPVPEREA